jgi:hypothetical protein
MSIKAKQPDGFTGQIACGCTNCENTNLSNPPPVFMHGQVSLAVIQASQEIYRVVKCIFTQTFWTKTLPPRTEGARPNNMSPVSIVELSNGEYMPATMVGTMNHVVQARSKCLSELSISNLEFNRVDFAYFASNWMYLSSMRAVDRGVAKQYANDI